MKQRKFAPSFHACFYNGDWHTKLMSALRLAEQEKCSEKKRELIAQLKAEMEEDDECSHTVTISEPTPPGVSFSFLMRQLRYGECAIAESVFEAEGFFTVVFKERGSREYVEAFAKDAVMSDVRQAKRALSDGTIPDWFLDPGRPA